jgi:hypothetical protein
MARWYRGHTEEAGWVKTFTQKIRENPDVEKLRGAVDFWALEAPFKTAAFIDSLVAFGVDRAVVSLGGGWYNPDVLAPLIRHINSKGLLSSRYDIYTDVWPPTHPEASGYRTEGYPEDVVVDADGSLHKGWLAVLDGNVPFQGYYTCSATHAEYARRWIADDLAKNPYNCRFIDVELASSLFECFSKEHPVDRHGDAMHRTALLDVVKNTFGLVTGDEEARDWAFSNVDYGEGTMTIAAPVNAGYDWSGPLATPGDDFIQYGMNAARRIPLHGLVYHDVHVPTWYTGDGASKVPAYWNVKDLFNILYASMPLLMPPDRAYWTNNLDRFLSTVHLAGSVFRAAGFEPMTDHRMLSADRLVQQTRFGNGWTVTVNFGESDHAFKGKTIPRQGFYATNGEWEVARIKTAGGTLAKARLEDRLFVHPYASRKTVDGVRTEGPVFLKKDADRIHLAFIGRQESVDVYPDSLPWPVSITRVQDARTAATVPFQPLDAGWIRIPKAGNARFYSILGTFRTQPGGSDGAGASPGLQVYPNPFHDSVAIDFSLSREGPVFLAVYNVRGERTALLAEGAWTAGTHRIAPDLKDLAAGVYLVRLEAEGKNVVRKMTRLR